MAMEYSEVDDIMEFWKDPINQQSIFDSIPLDCLSEDEPEIKSVLPTGFPSPPPQRTPDSLPYRFILDKEYTQYPYKSVGKLFWIREDTKEEIFNTTAFYIGDGKIMTVAHAFDKKIIKHDGQLFTKKIAKGIFVPAMTNNKDIFGEHHGFFRAFDCCTHSNYTKKKHSEDIYPHYDICTVKIGNGEKKEINGTEVAFKKVDVSTIPIITPCSLELDQPKKRYIIPGYGHKPYGTKENLNPQGKMMVFKGEYKGKDQDKAGLSTAMLTPPLWQGMSGGPWLNENFKAQGMQSGVQDGVSFSPYFTANLLSAVMTEPIEQD